MHKKLKQEDIENQETIECSTKICGEITCGDIALYLLFIVQICFFIFIYFYGNRK